MTKTHLLTAVVVLTNVAGNFSLSAGMRGAGTPESPLALLRALFDPAVACGVALLIVWTLAHMALLSRADLSYVLPVTGIGYVLAALAGRILLDEQVAPTRWTGIALIAAGVALVGRTAPRTTADDRS
ncbi:MAG: EamA family transporter [Bryobacteraceae bacterium]